MANFFICGCVFEWGFIFLWECFVEGVGTFFNFTYEGLCVFAFGNELGVCVYDIFKVVFEFFYVVDIINYVV